MTEPILTRISDIVTLFSMKSIDLVTERELSEELALGKFAIRELRKQRKIPYVQLGYRSIRYPLQDVAKALEKLTTEVAQ
jgi:hypothetical protein